MYGDAKKQFGNNDSATHLVPAALVVAMSLSDLRSTSIKDGVGARDKRRREDNFPCKDLAILRMGLFLGGLSLDTMIVKEQDWTVGRVNLVPLKRKRKPSVTNGRYEWLIENVLGWVVCSDHLLLPCGLPSMLPIDSLHSFAEPFSQHKLDLLE